MEKRMTSGEMAKKAGVSQKAIRLYDEKGLLKPTDYSEGNYRLYDNAALQIYENAKKENMTYREFVWKNKEDWYDLDFQYLKEHPDFRAFRIYEETEDVTNDYMDVFPKDAFEKKREYVCQFYHSDNHGDLYRDYKYLTKERADRFVDETVERIMEEIKCR